MIKLPTYRFQLAHSVNFGGSILNITTMPRLATLLFALLLAFNSIGQEKKAYQFFDQQGNKIDYGQVINLVKPSDILLFGELHNNPVCHWLQLEVTSDLYQSNNNLILGAEMFESDDQIVLDEYLGGKIKERHFKKESKLWNNYGTDYSPLVEFANANKLRFVATNVPRRYASLVAREGVEGLKDLDKKSKKLMAPIPFKFDPKTPGYEEMMQMDMGHVQE